MQKPDDERESARRDDAPQGGLWQWLAIGVLLACWLAEATLCAGQGS